MSDIKGISVNGTQYGLEDETARAGLNSKYEKPAGGIPDADIASASVWNAKGTYSKPSGGIPKTDLASAVQTSLGKADSAIPAPSSPASGAFLVWNGSAWVAQTLSTWQGGAY